MILAPDFTVTSFYRAQSPTHRDRTAIDLAPTDFSLIPFPSLNARMHFYFSLYLALYERLSFGRLMVNKGPQCLHFHLDLMGGAGTPKGAGYEETFFEGGRCVNRLFRPQTITQTRAAVASWFATGYYGPREQGPRLYEGETVLGAPDFVRFRISRADIPLAKDLLSLAFPSDLPALFWGAGSLVLVYILSR